MEYAPVQLGMARRFVHDLLASETSRPVDKLSEPAKAVLPHMVRSNFGMTAVRMIYGIDVRDPVAEAEYVGVPERVLHFLNECATPGRFLVDFFPWSQSITLAGAEIWADLLPSEIYPSMVPRGPFQALRDRGQTTA